MLTSILIQWWIYKQFDSYYFINELTIEHLYPY